MGSWFSNFHIRKTDTLTRADVSAFLTNLLGAQHYIPTDSADEADGAYAIVTDDVSGWFSIYSDLICFEDPAAFSAVAKAAAGLHTDVLGISCFDSDYLYLNLVNADDGTDAWLGIGSAAGLGIKRRTGLAAWKKKVEDFPALSAAAKEKYVFAEEFLANASASLRLPDEFAMASYEYLADIGLAQQAQYLYFKLPQQHKTAEPPRFVPNTYSLMPCAVGKPATVNANNMGGASRGLSVYFLGSYVEHEEITFYNVALLDTKCNPVRPNPIELHKEQLPDGQWVYAYHDPGYRIPEKVDERLPFMKRHNLMHDQEICVRFIPRGNPRKLLEIKVVLVPHKNPEGQTSWCLLDYYGSKKAVIDSFNKTQQHWIDMFPDRPDGPKLLREEDFD